MPTLETYYGPGSASTVTPAGPGPGGPSELENFYRELLKRQSMQPQPQQSYSAQAAYSAPSRQAEQNARNQQAAETYRPEESAFDVARRNDAMQEMAYKKRLREIDLNPPTKWIESRPGVQGGYAPDVTALPLSMRPQNAGIQHGPQDAARAQGQFDNNAAFDANLDRDRARARQPLLGTVGGATPNNNAYYGR